MRVFLAVLFILPLFVTDAMAQRGDRKGHKMVEVWRDMEVPEAPVVPPEKALDTFKIAPGFKLQLFASEPMVKTPVAIRWDGDGRMWVVEMVGYMPNVDGKGEEQLKNGRISGWRLGPLSRPGKTRFD